MLKYEGLALLVKLFFTHSSFPASCTVFDHKFGIRLGALEMPYILKVPSRIGCERIIRTSLTLTRWVVIFFVHLGGYFQANPPFDQSLFVAVIVVEFPMPSFLCQWKPFWIPVGESLKKACLEEWIFTGDDSSDEQRGTDFPVLLHSTGNTDYIRDDHPPTPRPSRHPDSLPWEPTRPQDKAYFW